MGHYTEYSCMCMQSMNLIWPSMWSGGVLTDDNDDDDATTDDNDNDRQIMIALAHDKHSVMSQKGKAASHQGVSTHVLWR